MSNKKSEILTKIVILFTIITCLITACAVNGEEEDIPNTEVESIEQSKAETDDGKYTEKEISFDTSDESPADLSPVEEPEDIEHLVIFDVECLEDFSDDIFVGLDKIWNYHFCFLTKEDNYHHEFTINKDELELYNFSFKSLDDSTLSWDVDDDPDNYEYHIKCSISRSDSYRSDNNDKDISELKSQNSKSNWNNWYTIIYDIPEYPEEYSNDIYVELAEDAMPNSFTSFWLSRENNYHAEIAYYGSTAYELKSVGPNIGKYFCSDSYRYYDDDYNIYIGFSLYEDMPEDYYEKNYG